MKRYLVIISIAFLSLCWVNQSYAQDYKPPTILNDPDYDFHRRLGFGFSLGINVMDFHVTSNAEQDRSQFFVDNSHLVPGFNVNVISDYRIVPTLHVRFMPGLAFGQRNLTFYDHYRPNQDPSTMKLESSFIELPLMLKYSAVRETNTRPYLIAGTNFRIDMASYKKLNIEEGVLIRLIKGDFYYEFGFGVDYFLTYFKLSTEIKFSSGFLNVIDRAVEEGEDFAQGIDIMRSQLFTLKFHFE